MKKIKTCITLFFCLMLSFAYAGNINSGYNAVYAHPQKYCVSFSCCSMSFLGVTISSNVFSGSICFESAGARTASGSQLTRVQIIPGKEKIQAGILKVKEDTKLTVEETGAVLVIKKGEYETNDQGYANVAIVFE